MEEPLTFKVLMLRGMQLVTLGEVSGPLETLSINTIFWGLLALFNPLLLWTVISLSRYKVMAYPGVYRGV